MNLLFFYYLFELGWLVFVNKNYFIIMECFLLRNESNLNFILYNLILFILYLVSNYISIMLFFKK